MRGPGQAVLGEEGGCRLLARLWPQVPARLRGAVLAHLGVVEPQDRLGDLVKAVLDREVP
jgi:hypothetical protein